MKLRVLFLASALSLHASVVGTSRPAPSLTVARIMTVLPAAQRGPWLDYVRRSEAQKAEDKRVLAAERAGMASLPPLPKQGFSTRSMPLNEGAAFYATAEARQIGDVIVSFQTPAGGWSKNLDMRVGPRAKGQSFTTGNRAPVASPGEDFDKPEDEDWHYVGTLDNDATNTELHFLARLAAANPGHDGDAFRASLLRGVSYLLNAQFPNGGWPQVWPLEGGYHDAITFNDDAVIESAELLRDVGAGTRIAVGGEGAASSTEDFSFIPKATQARAREAVAKALDLILKTQVRVPSLDGHGSVRTIWAQQHDPLTLEPVAARNFEPAALSSTESASVLVYLMALPNPSPAVQAAVNDGVGWFQAHEVIGYTWSGGRATPGGRKLTAVAGAGPLWARFYSIETGTPVFGDRDRSIHDYVMELSLERRNGYGWYGDAPARALAAYTTWSKRFPAHREAARGARSGSASQLP